MKAAAQGGKRALGVSLFLAVVTACKNEPPPKSVRLELVDVVLSAEPAAVLVYARDTDGVESLIHKDAVFSVEPPEVASVTPTGTLTCLRSADATVVATLRGVSNRAPLKCRLVEKISVPSLGQRDIADGPISINVQATTKDNKTLADVPVALTTPNSSVVRVQGATLQPISVGKAVVNARAGNATATFNVEIVRGLKPDAVALNDGRQVHLSLPEGKYELVVQLQAEHKLKMEWRGAPYCDYSASAQVHRTTCALRVKGAVVFDNPAFLASGSKDVSLAGITVREVP